MPTPKIKITHKDVDVVAYARRCMDEARRARDARMQLNAANRSAYQNVNPYAVEKIEGQSDEFLPKTSITVEQFKAFIKRGLVQAGRFFSVEMPEGSPIDGNAITNWLHEQLRNLPGDDDNRVTLALRVSDAVGVALLEAYVPIKVHGGPVEKKTYQATPDGGVEQRTITPYQLRIDLIRTEDFYEDATGRGLYVLHDSERDLHYLTTMADRGVYDAAVVREITESFTRDEYEYMQRDEIAGQSVEILTPRRPVRVTEFWGTVLTDDGLDRLERVFFTYVNDKWLVREPQPWPYWHGGHPFEKLVLLRVPFSVVHKALYDQVVPLNIALNELFNLILDGGIAAVWGVSQIHPDYLEDESQVAGGVAQGTTLVLNEAAPPGAKAYETVATGSIPPEALAVFNLLSTEYNSAALTNELRLGALPRKEVRATEIAEITNTQAAVLDSITADAELSIENIIRKAYLLLLQYSEDLETDLVRASLGLRSALALARMSPGQRFVLLAGATFKVYGLSATLARARDFQRLMALLQITTTNPMLLRSFLRRYSADKLLTHAFRLLNVDPNRFERTPEEVAQLPQEMQEVMALFGMTQGGNANAQGAQARPTGEAGIPSEINQMAKPSQAQ